LSGTLCISSRCRGRDAPSALRLGPRPRRFLCKNNGEGKCQAWQTQGCLAGEEQAAVWRLNRALPCGSSGLTGVGGHAERSHTLQRRRGEGSSADGLCGVGSRTFSNRQERGGSSSWSADEKTRGHVKRSEQPEGAHQLEDSRLDHQKGSLRQVP
jgi:hypothetical protein